MTDGAPALPVTHMDRASHTASDEAATILIAEDNEPLRQLLFLFLEGEGFQVLQGRNGKEALTIAKEYVGTIDVLISDVLMPELDGAGLAVKMWELRPQLRLIVMSSFSPGTLMLEGRWRFIRKPFSPGLLIQTIREVLAQPQVAVNGNPQGACGAD